MSDCPHCMAAEFIAQKAAQVDWSDEDQRQEFITALHGSLMMVFNSGAMAYALALPSILQGTHKDVHRPVEH